MTLPLILSWALVAAGAGVPTFRDVAADAGIDFTFRAGVPEKDYIIEVIGGGVALFDYDRDGDLDIYFVNAQPYDAPPGGRQKNRLFRNDGPWRFTDVTDEAGVGDEGWGCGVAVADVDGDGDPDLYVTNYGADRFYRNRGNGTFEDATEAAGLGQRGWGASAVFGDYDGDGRVDLYVANYVDFDPKKVPRRGERANCALAGIPVHCGPVGLIPARDVLYHNRGGGVFEDVSEASGIRKVPPSYGLGAIFTDIDRDGRADIYVANDSVANFCLHNEGDGTFEDVALELGIGHNEMGQTQAGMGVDIGDLTGDGLEDIFVCNFSEDYNTFYRNEGDGFFADDTSSAGIDMASFHHLGWGTLLLDADLDGDQDIFVANGHIYPQIDRAGHKVGYRQNNQLFLNDGAGRFTEVTKRAGPAFAIVRASRGAACGDLDGDGDLDIVVSNLDGPASVLENAGPPENHWIALRLEATRGGPDALGSWIAIRAGGKAQTRYVRSGKGYASHSELAARFGLGRADRIASLVVQWPDGRREAFAVAGVDRVLTLRQGTGRAVAAR